MHKIVNKGWGYEIWIENNELYCGKLLHVLPGKFCSVHYHKNKKEIFYVISGVLNLQLSASLSPADWESKSFETKLLTKGESLTIETYTAHRFTSDLHYACEFIEFSTHHADTDSYRIIKGD